MLHLSGSIVHQQVSILQEQLLLEKLYEQDPVAQKWMYERYAPVLFAVCRRYSRSREDAEEALVSGFYKIFTKIQDFNSSGSLEGWMRRIMVNESLMLLRRTQPLVFPGEDLSIVEQEDSFSVEAAISAAEILELVETMPAGYRTVFNLYVMEGFKHHEIAELLGISIHTSKSQLILARERLRELLRKRLGI